MAFKDKERQREYHREWYQRNKKRRREINDACRKRRTEQFQEYKRSLNCTICGENNACCLDFHHHNNDKEYPVAEMAHNTYSWEKIMKEIEKCTVLCKNCHAKVHAGLINLPS